MNLNDYRLNPYCQIIESPTRFEVYAPPTKDVNTPMLEFSKGDSEKCLILQGLVRGDCFTSDALLCVFRKDEFEFLTDNQIIKQQNTDITSFQSRTDAFYLNYLSASQRERIRKSCVLILGCGGIGSTIAWHMASMEISELTMLDFDIVEESNLNRNPLFSREDVGLKKVEVIRRKLNNLNPNLKITTYEMRIQSENALESICTEKPYDLIIKALDSPSEFPIWLDHVCEKHHLKYISGITLRDRVLLGPTFIPGVSAIGWSDIILQNGKKNKIYGTVPSIGIMLFHAVDMLAVEALKVLTGNYEALKYCGIIHSKNLLTGEELLIQSRKSVFQRDRNHKTFAVIALNLACIVLLGLLVRNKSYWELAPLLASLILPYISFGSEKNIMRMTFIDSIIGAYFETEAILIRFLSSTGNVPSLIAIRFILISLISLLCCVLNRSIIALINKVRNK